MKEALLKNIQGFLSTGKANLSEAEFEELLDSVQSDIDALRGPILQEDEEEEENA
jgi:hypothetical protein